ncbi:MAG: cytoplasmic protein [Chloroflexi bacterium]|nr:cytoplasmic protein [Chloroflexota bacterium]
MLSSVGPKIYSTPGGLATAVLRREHEAAMRVLNLLDRAVIRLKGKREISPFFFEQVVDFLEIYIGCAHHAKEEEILFPYLKEKSIEVDKIPIDTIHQDHEEEHRLVRQLEIGFELFKLKEPSGAELLIEVAGIYTHIARRHILKENSLFMLADERLSPDDQIYLRARFDLLERNKLYEGTPERLKELVNELERQAFHWE